MFLRRLLSCFVFVLLALFAAGSGKLHASTICVSVKDFANQPLPGARVTVFNLQSGEVTVVRTGEDGGACTSPIPEGLYSVEVGLSGFLNVRYYPVRLSVTVRSDLQFRLPFGEITEGGLRQDAVVSGTLKDRGEPVGGGTICLLEPDSDLQISCAKTNELGEYALSVPPGKYRVELRRAGRTTQRSRIEVPSPGIYRNIITVAEQSEKR